MTNKNDGGLVEHMKLRDYFAIKALRVIMASDHVDGQGDEDRHSEMAYRYADAMLRARVAQSPRETQDRHIAEFGQ